MVLEGYATLLLLLSGLGALIVTMRCYDSVSNTLDGSVTRVAYNMLFEACTTLLPLPSSPGTLIVTMRCYEPVSNTLDVFVTRVATVCSIHCANL